MLGTNAVGGCQIDQAKPCNVHLRVASLWEVSIHTHTHTHTHIYIYKIPCCSRTSCRFFLYTNPPIQYMDIDDPKHCM